jgi:deazaflavin-dependent oxidoreductase (nitroreductase family)
MTDPAPRPWFAEHVDRYLATNGEDGHDWNGKPTLLLTTRGRRSGELHTLPLIYGRDGDNFLIVASRGGAPKHPSWYLNLVAEPEVGLQVRDRVLTARAHTADPDEKRRLWPVMTGIFPDYDDYQTKTDREIPLVVLEPVTP